MLKLSLTLLLDSYFLKKTPFPNPQQVFDADEPADIMTDDVTTLYVRVSKLANATEPASFQLDIRICLGVFDLIFKN